MSDNGETPALGREQQADPHHHTKRDAETQMVLGAFVVFISVPVLIGTYWATTAHARVINLLAGLVLFIIGILMAVLGWRNNKRLKGR